MLGIFISSFLKKEQVDHDLLHYFLKGLKCLNDSDKNVCEGMLSNQECTRALFDMANNRSLGIGGFPMEFSCTFWDFLEERFVNMANSHFKHKHTQKLGVISLICKNSEKSTLLNYWKPISLLYVDYKIFSKCLTNRLKKVLRNLIHIDQTAVIPGRSIKEHIHLLINILDYSKQKDVKCILFSLDQSKAFYRVDHSFMFSVLKKFGFGNAVGCCALIMTLKVKF